MRFTEEDIDPMSLGARVLGSGGAGEPYLADIMLRKALTGGGYIDIVSLQELSPDAEVAPVALVGSPHVIAEKLLNTADIRTVFSGGTLRKQEPNALMPYELAGINAVYPLVAAAVMGMPLLDADFVGRGVPSFDMTILGVDDAHPSSHIICDARGRTLTLITTGSLSMESLVRPLVEAMGSMAVFSTSSLDRAFLERHSLAGGVTRCLQIGRLFSELPEMDEAGVASALAAHSAALLGTGRIIEKLTYPDRFGPRAALTIKPDNSDTAVIRVEQRNEFHIVAQDGVLLAAVPDIIVIVDRQNWEPLSTEEVAIERDVHVLALPVHERWYRLEALDVVGPRAFGYGIDHVRFTPAGGAKL